MALRYFEACKQLMADSWEEDVSSRFPRPASFTDAFRSSLVLAKI